MGKIKKFVITLDEDKDTYFAGERIAGHVLLKLTAPIQMLRLVVLVKGFIIGRKPDVALDAGLAISMKAARCPAPFLMPGVFVIIDNRTWDRRGKSRCTSGGVCKERVYHKEVTLYGHQPDSRRNISVEHSAGRHKYAFSFQLSEQLPSSVEEKHGGVTYEINARIVSKRIKILASKEMTITKPIFVKEVIDTNEPGNSVPLQSGLWKNAGFFAKKNSRKEALLLTLERKVYCPGEDVQVTIRYKDVVPRKMGSIKARLIKYTLFHPKKNGKKYATRTLVSCVNDDKKLAGRIYQKILTIPVPDKTSATNVLTKAIKLNYSIHLKIDGYPEAKFPITIGTIPLATPMASRRDEQGEIGVFHESNLPEYTSQLLLEPTAPPYSEFEDGNMEWDTNFVYPDQYVPENEFDLPPTYQEAIDGMDGQDRVIVVS